MQELLQSGVIQRSQSSFSSHVILVKKKDGTWRMCIDYHHLNAMTRFSKFPAPIIEELLDELHGALVLQIGPTRGVPPNQIGRGRGVQNSFPNSLRPL